MVMRWKILEMAKEATSLAHLLQTIKDSEEFDINEVGALELLSEYSESLPDHIKEELL